LGAGLEVAYLTTLVTHPRFQRLVDARKRGQGTLDAAQGRQELIAALDPPSRQRLTALEGKRERLLNAPRRSRAGDLEIESTRDALDRMIWIYLKLLVARHQLLSTRAQADTAGLAQRIAGLERDLAVEGTSAALRDSWAATLKLLKQRQENLERCEE